MGKYLDKFKRGAQKIDEKVQERANPPRDSSGMPDYSSSDDFDDFDEDVGDNRDGWGDEVGIQQSQKPESFHHFILENTYQDLEMSIRGYKKVLDKDTKEWRTIRKKAHCFTDEESEEILRTAQSHLATDIKLGFINKDSFPLLMHAIYKELAFLFESIAEYRYGRYGDYEAQYKMKLQNHKIFLELFTRVQANYSRSIQGQENKFTHESVKGQESLQGGRDDLLDNRRYS